MIKSSLLLPAHGNAPYILGAKILRAFASEICIPDYYGERQRKILMEELKDSPIDFDRVFLSESLGEILKPLLRDEKITRTFHDYVSSVNENFESKSAKLRSSLLEGVEAISLNGRSKKFSRFDFALNTGLPVLSPISPVFYAFVGEMSEIYNPLSYEKKDGGTIYMDDAAALLARIWAQVEATFERMFIPRLHSLAYLDGQKVKNDNSAKIIFTPPLESPYLSSNYAVSALDGTPVSHGSTLVIFSGTGKDPERLYALASSSQGLCFTLQQSPNSQLPQANQKKIHRIYSSAWGNPNITSILARSGLGSVWAAVVNKKPIGVLKAFPKDDPEIYHNAQMVEWAGIGKILDDNVEPLVNALPGCLSRIEEWHETLKKEFSTIDGIQYTANELRQMLS